jgi:hypothetical protein
VTWSATLQRSTRATVESPRSCVQDTDDLSVARGTARAGRLWPASIWCANKRATTIEADRYVSSNSSGRGELKNVIAHSVLEARGFSAVVDTATEVAGNRNDCRVSILHLGISGRQFWRVPTRWSGGSSRGQHARLLWDSAPIARVRQQVLGNKLFHERV